MQITYLWLNNQKYPMSFSLGASQEIAETYGSLSEVQERIKNGEMKDGESLEFMFDIVSILMTQGCEYFNLIHKRPEHSSPVDENGLFKPLTPREVGIVAGPQDIQNMEKAILDCMKSGQEKKIQTRSASKKKRRR